MEEASHEGGGAEFAPNRIAVFSPWDVRLAAELAIESFSSARAVLQWAKRVTQSHLTRNAPDPRDSGKYFDKSPLIRFIREAEQLDICIDNGYAFSQEELWEIENYMDLFSDGVVGWGKRFSPSATKAAFGFANEVHGAISSHRQANPRPTWAATAARLCDQQREFKLSMPESRIISNIHLEVMGAVKQYAQIDVTILIRKDAPLVTHNLSSVFMSVGFCLRYFSAAESGQDQEKAVAELREELPRWSNVARSREINASAMHAIAGGDTAADTLAAARAEFREIAGCITASKNLRGMYLTRTPKAGLKAIMPTEPLLDPQRRDPRRIPIPRLRG